MSSTVRHRPTPVASVLAILLAAAVTGLLARGEVQRLAIAGTVTGAGLLWVGGRRPDGGAGAVLLRHLLSAAGGAVVVASIAYGGTQLSSYGARAELLPALVGIVLVGLGVRPLSQRFARRLVSAGLALLLVGAVLTGIFERAAPLVLLAAVAGAIVVWDVAEHGISLGEQLRTDAHTRSVEAVHAALSTGYGAGLVGVGILLFENGSTGLPLGSVALLLAAAIISMTALYS